MGRMYTAVFENVSVSAAQDFFEFLPASQKPILLHAVFLSQISDTGDAEEEMLRLEIIRGHTTSGSGGSSVTPVPANPNDTAAGITAEVNNTTIASVGTPVIAHAEAFNIRVGWVYIPTPEMRIGCANSELLVVRLMAAPADAVTMSGTAYVEELN